MGPRLALGRVSLEQPPLCTMKDSKLGRDGLTRIEGVANFMEHEGIHPIYQHSDRSQVQGLDAMPQV